MPRPWKFRLPTQIHFGRGTLRRLGEIVGPLGPRVLLVGYRDAPPLDDVYARATRSLEKAALTVAPFREVQTDPTPETVQAGAAAAREAKADVILAIGGGSVLDAAKGIAAAVRISGTLWDHCEANRNATPIPDALPIIAVPTTAGTGSEVSNVAVFGFETPDDTPPLPLKAAIYGDALRPRHAIIDPDLALGMPPRLTAACAIDALGHAIESLLSRQSNPLCATLACRAAGLIFEALPQALADPEAPEPRESLALAAMLAGAAFTEAGVTVIHAMAHALSALLGVPHAEAVAMALPAGLRYNAAHGEAPLAQLAGACGLRGEHAESAAASWVIDCVSGLLQATPLPGAVPVSTGVSTGVSDPLVDRLTASALRSTPSAVTLNPRKVDAAALASLFGEILRR